MKRALLAGACALAVLSAAPRPAAAFVCGNCEQEATALLRHIESMGKWIKQEAHNLKQEVHNNKELMQLLETYQETVKIYNQSVMYYNAITGVRDLGTAVNALGVVGIRNPLPVNPYAVQSLLQGTGGVSGMTGNLSNLFNGLVGQNRVYEPQGQSWVEQELNRHGSGLSGAQAMALQLFQSAGERMEHLDDLRRRVSAADDPATRESLIAQMTAEGNAIQNQGVQAAALGNFMQAQVALQPQRVQEKRAQEIDAVLAEARARGVLP